MATVTRDTFTSKDYLPTPDEIAAQTADFRARKLEALASLPDPAENDRKIAREKIRRKRKAAIDAVAAKIEAKRRRSFESDADAQPMSEADICNVEFIDSRDLDSVLDGVIESLSFQHALEDCECRWTLGGNPDDFDLSDAPAPFGVVG